MLNCILWALAACNIVHFPPMGFLNAMVTLFAVIIQDVLSLK